MRAITRRSFSISGILASVLAGQALAHTDSTGSDIPSDADIRKVLSDRVEALSAGRQSIGIVAGVVGPEGRRIVSLGYRDKADARALTGDTAFEFGSVGKVFTALLLADMAVHHEVSLDDPVAKYFPDTVKLPGRNGRAITIGDLATHMSGLPFMPELPPTSNGGAYTKADLYNYLAGYKLTRDPGSDWDYSNLGYWLLSEALAARAHADFETLLRERILVPLKMAHSGFTLSPQMKADLAVGHDSSLQRSPPLSEVPIYDLMPAAGAGFYSTANDALTFLSAAMGYTRSPLARAFTLTVNAHRPIPGSPNTQALGWTLIGQDRDQLIFRDGGTFGFASCLVWDANARIGAVVLANVVSDVSDIGRHILRPAFPLVKQTPVTTHTEIPVSAAIFSRYVGRYEAQGEGTFTIALEGTYLTFEAPPDWGLPKLRIRPESKQDFFASELPLSVSFQIRPDGSATGMTIYPPRGQKGIVAQKAN
jgi:D-alanyl-D-alanine-carboxypeptidase/D-alanyl-D-alanine-endopeptidase